MLDRIDIFVEVPRVEYEKLSSEAAGEPSQVVRERVGDARRMQLARFNGTRYVCNAANGSNGSNGLDALRSLVAVGSEPSGIHCASGGQSLSFGLDDGDDNDKHYELDDLQ